MTTFLVTLTPMLTLFICMAIGFIFTKLKILPDGASQVMAKMEIWIFCPALGFITMARFCTIETIGEHFINMVLSTIGILFAVFIAIFLSRAFGKKNSPERGVYAYSLAFANSGYVGEPFVLAMFGEMVFSYYKLFCLPFSFLFYSWGVCVLMPPTEKKNSVWKQLLNPPTISMLIGMAVGLSGLGKFLPEFFTDSLDTLKACMGPVAMLLAGAIIAKYDAFSMLKKGKVYVATALRLVVLPAVMVAFTFCLKTLANIAFGLSIGNDILFIVLIATATPVGLNSVVFPEAYGGNSKTGAGLVMISHTLCVITIPLLYTLMVAIFGAPFQ